MPRSLVASLLAGPVLLLAALVAPGMVAAADPIVSAACVRDDQVDPPTVSCDLWAKTGTLALPTSNPSSTNIWGFATWTDGTHTSVGPASVPGPVLVATSGDTVTVNLTNQLSVTTSILFEGQAMAPDLTGVAAGGTTSYTFTAGAPGTYLYEAGLLPGTQYQVAKGLYGALVVRPAGAPPDGSTGKANDADSTGFDDEALVVLGEVDVSLNASATPWTFDLRGYAPRYFLVNGAAYPQTASIATTEGNALLLRYLNAGLQHHSMGVLGLRQAIVNDDGSALPQPKHVIAETIAPGQGIDALVTIPPSNAPTSVSLLYDASFGLNNSTGTGANAGLGGMLVRIVASGAGPSGDNVGPITSNVAVDPGTGALTARVSDVDTGGADVTAAEYFVDTLGSPGTGTATTGAFGTATVDPVSGTVDLGSLGSGTHTVYVRGLDAEGNWGAFASTAVSKDAAGPVTSGVTLTPMVTNNGAVALSATADDTTTGGATIKQAEFFIDALGADGSGSPMTVANPAAVVSSVSASIATGGLSAGSHTIYVHARDFTDAWGGAATATLTIDRTGPTASAGSVVPSPSNGQIGVNSGNPSVRVAATLTDSAPATIKTGEVWIDTVGAPGAGIPMVPSDGAFSSASEAGFADIPLTTIAQLSNGSHTIYVRGKDSAGNWGATLSVTLVVDKTAPSVTGLTLTPSAANAQAVAIDATAGDTGGGGTNIVRAEYFIDTVGANGAGQSMTVATAAPTSGISATIPSSVVAGLSTGTHTVAVHAQDAAGSWGTFAQATLRIDRTAPTFSSISLAPNPVALGSASTTVTVNGASDGASGSGVVGGEWWIGNSNITPGTGTAFSGTTATIPTSSLAQGQYTVRVRIRDAAGNWSTGNSGVRTSTLVVAPVTIFSDGFEGGSTGAWSSRSTNTTSRLDVTTAAALAGTYGLQAQGDNTNYVQINWGSNANPAAPIYDAKFLFRPNAQSATGQSILVAATGSQNNNFTTGIFRVRYRLNAGTPQVQIQVGNTTNNAWVNILGGTSTNTIEVVWQAAGSGGSNAGTLVLYVNGAQAQSLATSSTSAVAAVRLGVVANSGNNALEYFDGFTSKRTETPYGP